MTTVTAWLGRGRAIDVDSFADLTTATCIGVAFTPDGALEVTFARTLTSSERAAVTTRITSSPTPGEDT